MKKFLSILFTLILCITLVGCGKKEDPKPTPNPNPDPVVPTPTPDPEPEEWVDPKEPVGSRHLIKDEFGNYGGTVNRSKYGYGAPLNGENDIQDSEYFVAPDYYYYHSTDSRTILSKFRPYQQTMADSGGIACALMVLNYYGEDVINEYNEVNLVNKYEEINKTTVYKNGTTAPGLSALFRSLGYNASYRKFTEVGSTTSDKIAHFSNEIAVALSQGQVILLRYQDTREYGWHAVIGIDDMGTDYPRDDVLIMADPYDDSDHYQDGYYTMPAGRVYRWWADIDQAGVVDTATEREFVKVLPKNPVKLSKVKEELPEVTVPENHLLKNPDGSYGGTRDEKLYGVIPEKNGETDHHNSGYYAFPDYYNMVNTTSRTIMPNYRAFQQTMASSCGICSTLSVLHFYGVEMDFVNNVHDEVWLVKEYERLNNSSIKGKGVGAGGLLKLVESMGFKGESHSYYRSTFVSPEESMCYPTYESFIAFLKPWLQGGSPLPVSMRPLGGHWEVIIGYDDMGTENVMDDVIVLADSHDTQDHYQDGYNTFNAMLFYRQWYNGSYSTNQQHYYFRNK